MPSYYHSKPKKFPKRYELLAELRSKTIYRRKLEEFFNGILENADSHSELGKPKFSKKRFTELLYLLRQDGLAEEVGKGANKIVNITRKGIEWLNKFNTRPHMTTPTYASDAIKSEQVIIISYDIPERLRIYRNWLRIALRGMKFMPVQQSVWVGKIKLPSDFIADITRYELEKYA